MLAARRPAPPPPRKVSRVGLDLQLDLLLWYAIPAGSRILAPPDHTGLRIWYDTVDFRVFQPCMLDLGRSGQDHMLFSHRPARRPWDGSQSTGSEHRI